MTSGNDELQEYDLVTRYCACGCGLSFRTLRHSQSRYASVFHDERFKQEFDSGKASIHEWSKRVQDRKSTPRPPGYGDAFALEAESLPDLTLRIPNVDD